MSSESPLLVQVVELGGYPNFEPLYRRLGFRVETINIGRKAISLMKKQNPEVVVAEFNYQFDFRDRTSQLESILAVLQPLSERKVVVFYNQEEGELLDKVAERFPGFTAMAYPIDEAELEAELRQE